MNICLSLSYFKLCKISILQVVSLRGMSVSTRFHFVVLAANYWICWISKTKKYRAYDCFHGNGPYGKILTKKEPIRMLGFTSRLSCHVIINNTVEQKSVICTGQTLYPNANFKYHFVACFHVHNIIWCQTLSSLL